MLAARFKPISDFSHGEWLNRAFDQRDRVAAERFAIVQQSTSRDPVGGLQLGIETMSSTKYDHAVIISLTVK